MNVKIGDTHISEERYIEIKQMAYKFYEEYNKLDRVSRTKYLDALPKLNTPFENLILRTTLLFPDTPAVLKTSRGAVYNIFKTIAANEDNITNDDLMAKRMEYSTQKIHQLIQEGTLKVMEEPTYPDHSISEKEYISIKEDAIQASKEFTSVDLPRKKKFIESIAADTSYQTNIQLATLLIPNDVQLMQEMTQYSDERLAGKYKVPVKLIEFKKHEYEYQGTKNLIEEQKITRVTTNKIWFQSELDDRILDGIWDQSFYRGIENNQFKSIEQTLDKMYTGLAKIEKK